MVTMNRCLMSVMWIVLFLAQQSLAFCPVTCLCSDQNKIVNCVDQVLFTIPQIPNSVERLNVSNTVLGPDLIKPLSYMNHLTHLDLSHNILVRISNSTFLGLRNLTYLNLSNNKLRSLEEELFMDNKQLQVLDLSGNALTSMSEAFYKHLHNLQELYLSGNNFYQLKLGLRFQVLDQLNILDLSNNDFGDVTNDAFENIHQWGSSVNRSLSLAYCKIASVENGTFIPFGGLHKLNLSGISTMSQDNLTLIMNDLQHLNTNHLDMSFMNLGNVDHVFASAPKLSLLQLNLSHNQLESISMNAFQNVGSLQYLDISHNNIKLLPAAFTKVGNLKFLDLSHNQLRALNGPSIAYLANLEHLTATHNRFDDRNLLQFNSLRQLKVLDLSFNTLDSLITTGNNAKLEELILAGNNISSLDMIPDADSLRVLDVSENKLTTLGPYLFSSSLNIKTVDFSYNEISVIDSLAFLPNASISYDINLSGNMITRLEYGGWSGARLLNLSANQILHVDFHAFQGMNTLEVLDLSHNEIQALDDETFKYLINLETLKIDHNNLQSTVTLPKLQNTFKSVTSLQIIDMSHNKISHLENDVFLNNKDLTNVCLANNRFSAISPRLFKRLNKLTKLDISGNPFICNCNLIPLLSWLKSIDPDVYGKFSHNYFCVGPGERTGLIIFNFKVAFLECDNELLELIVFGSLGALTIFVGIVGTIVCRMYQKWSEKIMLKKEKDKSKTDKVKGTYIVDELPLEILNELDDKLKRKLMSAKQNGYSPIANGGPNRIRRNEGLSKNKGKKKPNNKREKDEKASRSRTRSKSKEEKSSRSRSKSKDRYHNKDQEREERRYRDRIRKFEKELRYTLARYNPTNRWDSEGQDRWRTMGGHQLGKKVYNPEQADGYHTMPNYRHPRQTLLDDWELKNYYSFVKKHRNSPQRDLRREYSKVDSNQRLSPVNRYDIVRVAKSLDVAGYERSETDHQRWSSRLDRYNTDPYVQYIRDSQLSATQWTNTMPKPRREMKTQEMRGYSPYADTKHFSLPTDNRRTERQYVELPFPTRRGTDLSLDMEDRRGRQFSFDIEDRREGQFSSDIEDRRGRELQSNIDDRFRQLSPASEEKKWGHLSFDTDHRNGRQCIYEDERGRQLQSDTEDRKKREQSPHNGLRGNQLNTNELVERRVGKFQPEMEKQGRKLSYDTDDKRGKQFSLDHLHRSRSYGSIDFKAKKRKFEDGLEGGVTQKGKDYHPSDNQTCDRTIDDFQTVISANQTRADVHREGAPRTPDPDYPADNVKQSDWV